MGLNKAKLKPMSAPKSKKMRKPQKYCCLKQDFANLNLPSFYFRRYQTKIFCFIKKIGQPRPLFRLFSVFSNKHDKFLQQIYVKKCPYSIRCRDSNPQPLKRESPPITTRPGLPPKILIKSNRWGFEHRRRARG